MMFDLIRKLVSPATSRESSGEGDRSLRTQVAAAVILLEAAHADEECGEEERIRILETLKSSFGLTEEYAGELMEMAAEKRAHAVDIWEFTNEVNQSYSHQEKLDVMEAVWRVIHADGELEKHEDHFARKLAVLLRLSHREMIDAKLRAKGTG
ncbi:MAG: TerB family tellurite resistance protein [Nitrospirota bacterium]|jgi:uncharacterized tellurite resistance protein B-like protein